MFLSKIVTLNMHELLSQLSMEYREKSLEKIEKESFEQNLERRPVQEDKGAIPERNLTDIHGQECI